MKAAAIILLVSLTACSSSPTAPSPTKAQASLPDAVRAYTSAFAAGRDDAAWATVSARCKKLIPEPDYRATVVGAPKLYPGLRITSLHTSVNGNTGTATYGTNKAGSYENQRWVLEDARWKYDNCS